MRSIGDTKSAGRKLLSRAPVWGRKHHGFYQPPSSHATTALLLKERLGQLSKEAGPREPVRKKEHVRRKETGSREVVILGGAETGIRKAQENQ